MLTMNISENIRHLREQKSLLQKEVAAELDLGISHYSKIENGQREASVKLLSKLASFYGLTIDQIVNMESDVPQEVTVEDKSLTEQVRLIQKLNDKDKETIFSIIDTMLTKQKFQEFFQQNLPNPA